VSDINSPSIHVAECDVHVAERYGTLVTANLHYGDNHTVKESNPEVLVKFPGPPNRLTGVATP